MSENSLYDIVRELEIKEFPELRSNIHHIHRKKGPIDYKYWTPSHHVKTGLINNEILKDLRGGKKSILSLGCGNAYLERLLVGKLGVSNSQIELVDQNLREIPSGFTVYSFDITKSWPNLKRTYDYIFIPESFTWFDSLFVRKPFNKKSESIIALDKLISRSLNVLNDHGQIRGDGHNLLESEISFLKERLRDNKVPNQFYCGDSLIVVRKTGFAR